MKRILSICILFLILLLFWGCSSEPKYKVNLGDAAGAFKNAKRSYLAGEEVKLYYTDYLPDNDYTFVVDGKQVLPSFNEEKGYIITFMMPDHDVDLFVHEITPEEIDSLVFSDDNLEKTLLWPGSTLSAVGLSDYMVKGHSLQLKGKCFDAESNGSLFYTNEGEFPVNSVTLYIDEEELSFEDAYSKLKELCGEAFEEGEEPYAAANGGDVYWYLFYTGEQRIRLSKGSEYSFYVIESTFDNTSLEELSWDFEMLEKHTGYAIDLEDAGFTDVEMPMREKDEDGIHYIINAKYEDKPLAIIIYPGTETVASINGLEPKDDNDVYSSFQLEDGQIIIWKEDGDLWSLTSSELSIEELVKIQPEVKKSLQE